MDRFNRYNQIHIYPEDQEKETFTCPWRAYAYKVFHFGLCNALATFQREIISIFSDFLHDSMEIYMDEFTVVSDTFDEALTNLEKVLKRCRETNLALRK
jgi:hypothetical protein